MHGCATLVWWKSSVYFMSIKDTKYLCKNMKQQKVKLKRQSMKANQIKTWSRIGKIKYELFWSMLKKSSTIGLTHLLINLSNNLARLTEMNKYKKIQTRL